MLATSYLLVGGRYARNFLSSCGRALCSRLLILLWERAALATSIPINFDMTKHYRDFVFPTYLKRG